MPLDVPYSTAVAGFWPIGCVPVHLKALMLSGRPFVFFGPENLFALAAADTGDVSHVKTCFIKGEAGEADSVLEWLDQSVQKFPEIRTICFMEIERFAREFFSGKIEVRFPHIFSRTIRGNLFPRACLYERRSAHDYVAWVKWQIWAVIARRYIAEHGLMVLGPTAYTIFPLCRLFPRAQRMLVDCPEPYDRTLVPDAYPTKPDQKPPAVLLFGYHTARKGTYWALEALAKFPKPLRAIVAGQCENASHVKQLCEALPSHIIAEPILERISDAAKETLFKRASVILLPYDVFLGSSGLVFEAMIYRRQILASDACAFDPLLLKSGAVEIHRRRDANEFLQKLELALSPRVDWNEVDFFLSKHGIQKFAETFLPGTKPIARSMQTTQNSAIA